MLTDGYLSIFLMYKVIVWFTQQQFFHAKCGFVVLVLLQVDVTQFQPRFRVTHVSETQC